MQTHYKSSDTKGAMFISVLNCWFLENRGKVGKSTNYKPEMNSQLVVIWNCRSTAELKLWFPSRDAMKLKTLFPQHDNDHALKECRLHAFFSIASPQHIKSRTCVKLVWYCRWTNMNINERRNSEMIRLVGSCKYFNRKKKSYFSSTAAKKSDIITETRNVLLSAAKMEKW